MLICAIVVFISLYFVRAGYGMLRDGKWGPQINNKLGWILMEAPFSSLCACSAYAPLGVTMRYALSFSGSSNSTT